MHEMQTFVADVRCVCLPVGPSVRLSVSLSVTRLHCAGVIRCSLFQIILVSCFGIKLVHSHRGVISKISYVKACPSGCHLYFVKSY